MVNNINKDTANFMIYFEKTWIKQHPGWYEGFAPGIPSTNNSLESTNDKIKSEATYRVKLPLGRFLEIVKNDMIEKWSKERDESKPYVKIFSETPTITHGIWKDAFHLNIDDRLTTSITLRHKKITYMSSGRLDENEEPIIHKNNVTKETKIYKDLKTKKSWTSFDHYSAYITRFWEICFVEDINEWQKCSTCSCSGFQKNNICKHLVLQAIRYNYVIVPLTAQTIDLEDLPRRGRPPTISKALQIDTTQKSAKRSQSVLKSQPNKKSKKS